MDTKDQRPAPAETPALSAQKWTEQQQQQQQQSVDTQPKKPFRFTDWAMI